MSKSANRSVIINSAGIFNFVPGHGFKLEPGLSYRVEAGRGTGLDVRFGSEADMYGALGHVRFTPNSDCKSRHPQPVMSALPPKADMCGAKVRPVSQVFQGGAPLS